MADTILLVDDDKYLVEMIQQYLEAKGFNVFTAYDGMQAPHLARTHKPALIILDVDMPVLSGLKTLEILRKDPLTQAIPVILLTGVVSDQVFPKVEHLPRVSHVKKPVQLEDFDSLIRYYLPKDAS
jgi:CheY-like chemotaxis protein